MVPTTPHQQKEKKTESLELSFSLADHFYFGVVVQSVALFVAVHRNSHTVRLGILVVILEVPHALVALFYLLATKVCFSSVMDDKNHETLVLV